MLAVSFVRFPFCRPFSRLNNIDCDIIFFRRCCLYVCVWWLSYQAYRDRFVVDMNRIEPRFDFFIKIRTQTTHPSLILRVYLFLPRKHENSVYVSINSDFRCLSQYPQFNWNSERVFSLSIFLPPSLIIPLVPCYLTLLKLTCRSKAISINIANSIFVVVDSLSSPPLTDCLMIYRGRAN